MKNLILALLAVVGIMLALFFGLSSITVNQTQIQENTQQQVQRNDNVQLTIIDTSRKITNIQWKVIAYQSDQYKFANDFINTELSLYQQINCKITAVGNTIYVFYPEFNSYLKIYTNDNKNFNTNINSIKIEPIKIIKDKFKK